MKISGKLLSVLLAVIMVVGVLTVAPITASAATNITVTKSEISSKGTYKAIQNALDVARSKASDKNPYNVKIEAGNYTLDHTLRIYSNTNLQLNNVTLTKASSASINMLHIGNIDTDKVGATGYNAYKNITINGGTINGNGGNNTLFKAAHCSNISLKGTTMRNNKAHLTEIAAVNGISFENCSFQDMVIRNNGTLTYEAIQVDILVNDHFNTYRMEDLPCKKVKVNGCTFKNCTRGVGSHTSINNAPHSDIKIINNTFTNMGSVAVQFQGVENCTIANNVIDNTPRGIAVYSVLNNGSGCYKASVLAKQGNVSQHYSDSYQTPKNANILITDNVIKRCGNVKDIYATYPAVGISAIGYNVPSNTSTLNKGNYYINGVTIKDNRIEVKGHGVRFSDARNCIADNNIITASLNTFDSKANYYGITAAEGSVIPAISNNIINKSASNGIFVVNSKCTDILNNAALNAGKYGIAAEKSTVSRITGNTIKNSTSNGVHLNNSTVSVIRNNALANIGAHAFNLCENAVGGTITDNIVTSCNGKYYNLGGTATTGTIVESDETSSIKLNQTALKLEVGSKATLTQTTQPNNVLTTYVWSSSNNDVATVSNGVVTAKAQGTATISVKTFNGKTASCTVTVPTAPTAIKLNRNTLSLGVGENYGLLKTVTPTNANQNVSWSSSNAKVATVDSNGKVVGKSVGTATVTAKTSNGKTATCKVTIKPAPSSVKISNSSLTLGKGETFTVSQSTNSGSYAWGFSWSSSNNSVATVTRGSANKAIITAKGNGTAYITIKTYNGKTAQCKVTVKPAPTSVITNPTSLTLGKGETYTINETTNSGSYANAANLKWSTSKSSVATVTKGSGNKAKITAKGTGTAYIKISLYNGKTAQCKVTVKPAPTSVKTNPTSLTLGKGETYTIRENTNNGSYANAANLKWSSTNTSVATVTKGSGNKAKITAKGTGTAYIKIKLYNGKTAQCKVTVKPAPTSVKLSKSSITLDVGKSYTISENTNSGSYANAANLKWSSTNSKVAIVTKGSGNKAKITAKGVGTAYIKITLYNGKTAQCKVTVQENYANEVLNLLNKERTKAGVPKLSSNSNITALADTRAKELVSKYSHTRPNGTTVFDMAISKNIKFSVIGENIAYGQTTPSEVINAWLNSPPHRKNMLSGNYKSVGIGHYKSGSTHYWVQVFIG